MYLNLALLAGLAFFYSVTSGRLERTPVGGAVLFTAFGLAFGPLGLGWLKLDISAQGLRAIAEVALALVLFTDAAKANISVLERNIRFPGRLLVGGLPLTILLGIGIGILLFEDLDLLEIALLATLLAPTDAALGKAVVTNKAVPARIRESLNVESGLNDGICVPILFLFLTLAIGEGTNDRPLLLGMQLLAEEIGIGLLVAVVVTVNGCILLRSMGRRGWLTESWEQLPVVALALGCFALAQFLHGSGFIAAFAGGLLYGWLNKHRKHEYLLAAESTGDTLTMVTWVIFGSAVIGRAVGSFDWDSFLYALLSLTVIRMLPVLLVLSGTGLRPGHKLFIGWFGPRGLASVVFAVIVLNANLPGGDTITMTAIWTISLSVLAHGLSANPLIARLFSRTSV